MKLPCKLLAAAAFAVGTPSFVAPAAAAPITAPSSLQNAAAAPIENVQWRRWGWAPGLAAGAIIGGAIAASRPWYGYDYYNSYDDYAYSPGYSSGPSGYNSYNYDYAPGTYNYSYRPGYSYSYSAGGNDDGYCSQRFRSYDPASGTYLGYDGQRHPCP